MYKNCYKEVEQADIKKLLLIRSVNVNTTVGMLKSCILCYVRFSKTGKGK